MVAAASDTTSSRSVITGSGVSPALSSGRTAPNVALHASSTAGAMPPPEHSAHANAWSFAVRLLVTLARDCSSPCTMYPRPATDAAMRSTWHSRVVWLWSLDPHIANDNAVSRALPSLLASGSTASPITPHVAQKSASTNRPALADRRHGTSHTASLRLTQVCTTPKIGVLAATVPDAAACASLASLKKSSATDVIARYSSSCRTRSSVGRTGDE